MNLQDGATNEIITRWPEYKQRNVGISYEWYGVEYADNMTIGIQLVRDHHAALEKAGETVWSIPDSMTNMLDDLARTT